MEPDSRQGGKPEFLARHRLSLILAAIALAFYAAMIVNHLPA